MRLCIDIGGTKVLIANVDDSGMIVKSERIKTPKVYDELIAAIKDALPRFDVTDTTIVAGAPGKIDRSSGIVEGFGNLPWKNVPLKEDLEKIIDTKVYIENDANLAALGEYYEITPPKHQVLYITVSTGIGGGIVTDGKLDPDHLDSEPGEILIHHDGELQMFEKIASGSAIVKEFGKRASEIENPKIWQEISETLAIGIINMLTLLEPDQIVIGGGVGTHFGKFKDTLQAELERIKPPLVDLAPISQAINPEEAVILGAWHQSKQLDEPTTATA